MTAPRVMAVVCNSGRKTGTGAGDRVYRAGGRYRICRRSPRSREVRPGRKKSCEQRSEGGGGSGSDGNGDLDSQITELQEDLESERAVSKKTVEAQVRA